MTEALQKNEDRHIEFKIFILDVEIVNFQYGIKLEDRFQKRRKKNVLRIQGQKDKHLEEFKVIEAPGPQADIATITTRETLTEDQHCLDHRLTTRLNT